MFGATWSLNGQRSGTNAGQAQYQTRKTHQVTGLCCRQATSIYFCKFYSSFFAQPLKRFTRIEDDALNGFVFATQKCFLFQREDEARASAFCARTEDVQHPTVVAAAAMHLSCTCHGEAATRFHWVKNIGGGC